MRESNLRAQLLTTRERVGRASTRLDDGEHLLRQGRVVAAVEALLDADALLGECASRGTTEFSVLGDGAQPAATNPGAA